MGNHHAERVSGPFRRLALAILFCGLCVSLVLFPLVLQFLLWLSDGA